MSELADRQSTLRQRIIALHEQGKITRLERDNLLAHERYVRGALQELKPKFGESFSDFKSRSEAHARCHGEQHLWDKSAMVPLDYRPIGAAYWETARCERCGTARVTIVNALDAKDRHTYDWPLDYKLVGVKTSRSDWKTLCRFFDLMHKIELLEEAIPTTATVTPIRDHVARQSA